MILWLTGNSGAGKTTLANKLKSKNTIILDGDVIREIFDDFDLSKDGRVRQNIRAAKLAKEIERQGYCVVVSVICPYESLRKEVQRITDCKFIYLSYENDTKNPDKPFEKPTNSVIEYDFRNFDYN